MLYCCLRVEVLSLGTQENLSTFSTLKVFQSSGASSPAFFIYSGLETLHVNFVVQDRVKPINV